ncbi:hypothetical protein [Sphingomonas sp. DT-204]|uniref:hypothetical protein n=1 Tax=Sphingomonas sp. DT-204 TaxID=3396166 RepID=UPI003F1D2E8A
MRWLRRWVGWWLTAIASFARIIADALERSVAPSAPVERAMIGLRERFPGAPDHWLRMIAERAPHLAETAPADEPLRGAAPPPFRSAMRPRTSRPAATMDSLAYVRAPSPVSDPAPPELRDRPTPVFRWKGWRRRARVRPGYVERAASERPSTWPPTVRRNRSATVFGERHRAEHRPSGQGWSEHGPRRDSPIFSTTERSNSVSPDFPPREEKPVTPIRWRERDAPRATPRPEWLPLPAARCRPTSFDREDPVAGEPTRWVSAAGQTMPSPVESGLSLHPRWPALPPLAVELDDAGTPPPRFAELAAEQESGRWSG